MPVSSSIDYASLATQIKQWARELGFADVGVAGIDLTDDEAYLERWLAEGHHGEMDYMARHGTRRSRPAELEPGTLRVISVRMDYVPPGTPNAWDVIHDREQAYIARYALGRDYHKVMRNRLQKLAAKIRRACRRLFAIARTSIPHRCWKRRSRAMRGLAGSASTRY